ncbi:MAG TPA: alpha-glucosidase [Thermotogota bacterium]|nr:alpha-glucosidase [Thermotogota bacterium]HRW92928.1 alpha-glucosidase [Thermotogota bacterium]
MGFFLVNGDMFAVRDSEDEAQQWLLEHSLESPAFFVGVGDATISMRKGNFTIDPALECRLPLRHWQVLEQGPGVLGIRFLHEGEVALQARFQLEKGRVRVELSALSKRWNRFWMRVPSSPEEKVFGCGEQFSFLNLRGKRVPLWTSEQGVGRNKNTLVTFFADALDGAGGDWHTTYFPQPTFVTSTRKWLHSSGSAQAYLDFRNPRWFELECWEIPPVVWLGSSPSWEAYCTSITSLVGKQPPLAEWSMDGAWLGLQGGTDVVQRKIEAAQSHGVQVCGLWIQDWEGKRITAFGKQLMWNWVFDPSMYPELPERIREWKEQGIRVLGYINPFLALEGSLYREASEKGYLVQKPGGGEYHVVVTTFPAAMLDLTNPEALEWIRRVIRENMIGIGLSGWMCDYGEYLPTDAVLFSGESAHSFHNRYPAVWAQTNWQAVCEAGKQEQIVFFTRAGFTGIQAHTPLVWAGDQTVNWDKDDGLPSTIPAALSLGLCGIGVHHSDLGGFTTLDIPVQVEGKHYEGLGRVARSKELFLRWLEMSAFTPVMRTHEGNWPHLNWQFDSDEPTLLAYARFSQIHAHLKPYFQELLRVYQQTGLPLMRPMFFSSEEEQAWEVQDQFLLGEELLVAPVVERQATEREVFFPTGSWVHLFTEEEFGPGKSKVAAPLGTPPVFFRQGGCFASLFQALSKRQTQPKEEKG